MVWLADQTKPILEVWLGATSVHLKLEVNRTQFGWFGRFSAESKQTK